MANYGRAYGNTNTILTVAIGALVICLLLYFMVIGNLLPFHSMIIASKFNS
jgi:hypothetical protein